nr:immunoglobulin light chain junction region [Macaca mulatta]MOW56434.1 immunoglobulin light chain junction region [Macaca mulatta]MOW56547.1 immunoglobulin light chain junction region [Macaca mulatta]MOW56863.1 immunoglobulin light chain junction region [Macaca mulatta]MOW56875.1 immunoglobulin light chain junction region [Macaca mulatta]
DYYCCSCRSGNTWVF